MASNEVALFLDETALMRLLMAVDAALSFEGAYRPDDDDPIEDKEYYIAERMRELEALASAWEYFRLNNPQIAWEITTYRKQVAIAMTELTTAQMVAHT